MAVAQNTASYLLIHNVYVQLTIQLAVRFIGVCVQHLA